MSRVVFSIGSNLFSNGRKRCGPILPNLRELWFSDADATDGRTRPVKRRSFLKSTLAGATAMAFPRIGRAEAEKTITFVPHADLASLDPVWTTADVTRNFSLAVC